jgi:hypothetical protein
MISPYLSSDAGCRPPALHPTTTGQGPGCLLLRSEYTTDRGVKQEFGSQKAQALGSSLRSRASACLGTNESTLIASQAKQ